MKYLRFLVPLIVVVALVVATEYFHLSGMPLTISWIIGFLFSMILTAWFEIKLRMRDFQKRLAEEKNKEEND